MSTDVFVECDVYDGMFSDERVVEIADQSFIVPRTAVRVEADKKRGRVRARLVKDADGEWIVLPTVYSDVLPRGRATIVKE